MKNKQPIVVLDYETGSSDPRTTEPIQLAACVINPHNLEIDYETSFCSLMKPRNFDALHPEALKVNGKTVEMLEAAPSRDIVWADFVKWVKQLNPKGSFWSAPIMAGYNIINFDWIIHERLCVEFGNLDKSGLQNLFSNLIKYDFMYTMWNWFEGTNDLEKYKLDVVRDYFGMSKDGAHDAMVDVEQTAQLISRFLKFQRGLYNVHKGKLKGSFSK